MSHVVLLGDSIFDNAFWATPTMTLAHLVLAGGLSGYTLLAVIYEERDHVAHFGRHYEEYRASACRARFVSYLVGHAQNSGNPGATGAQLITGREFAAKRAAFSGLGTTVGTFFGAGKPMSVGPRRAQNVHSPADEAVYFQANGASLRAQLRCPCRLVC